MMFTVIDLTEDKVILDFQITNDMPSFLELVPLMNGKAFLL